jgi:phosphoribosylamine---glycine ligase
VEKGWRVLVVGGGGREHALAWKFAASPRVSAVFCAPGNAGTADIGTNLPIAATDVPGIVNGAREHRIDFVMVGPEKPLALGLADALRMSNIPVCGHTEDAAMLETSKAFAKAVMHEAGIPTARSVIVSDMQTAETALQNFPIPVVIKADGLADGKGVVVAQSREEAEATLRAFLVDASLGAAGASVVIEEYLDGLEMSAIALVDGETVVPMVPSCDHKPVFDGNQGPNTGGMGTYAPPPQISRDEFARIVSSVLEPTARVMAERGTPLQGVLFAGIILTEQGPKVLEFNARFGDPETQVILPLLESDFAEAVHAVAIGKLAALPPLAWRDESAVCVVLTSGGYPGAYQTGVPIEGIETAPDDLLIFHAGTKRDDQNRLVTAGGRVLGVVGLGGDLAAARERAYAGVEAITFDGKYARGDIGRFGVS